MINTEVTNKSNLMQYSYDLDKKQTQITQLNQDKKFQQYLLFGALAILGLIVLTVLVLIRSNRQKQKANNLLYRQKQLIEQQQLQTNKVLSDLQKAQKQLIQSEKMASLGELTAGIAHEIQNPLNFVNNFSEVNIELIAELKKELVDGQPQEAMAIAEDLEQNTNKIHHHGRRADNIVKGMLDHSRGSANGVQQDLDLNKLAGECLSLAYHGFKAKYKDANIQLVTDLAESLPTIQAVA